MAKNIAMCHKIGGKNEKKKRFKKVILVIVIILVIFSIVKLSKEEDTFNEVNNDIQNEEIITGDLVVNDYEEGEIIKLESEEKYKGLILSNIELQLITKRECEIRADVRNGTKEMVEMQNIKIKLYDEEGNLIDTFGAQIDSIEPGGQTKLFALVRRNDISNITKIKIEEK